MSVTAILLAAALSQTPAAPPDAAPAAPPDVATATPATDAATPPAAAPAPAAPAPAKAAAGAPSPYTPTLFGFIDAQWSRTDAPKPAHDSSTFELRRARIGARGDVTPNAGYTILFDGADTSLKDAYASLKALPFLPGVELRFGQWKTPFGYEQPESDTKLLWVYSSYVVQALARSTSTTSLYATPDARDLGAGLIGKWTIGSIGAELAGSYVNGAGPNRKDDLDTKNVWGRAGVLLKGGGASLRAGASYGHGRQVASLGTNGKFDGVGTPTDDTYFWFKTYGGDVELDLPFLFVAAEWIQSDRDVTTYTSATTSTQSSFTARGWYVGAYGKSRWNVGPIFRAEKFDRNDTTTNDRNERYTAGAYVDLLPVNARLIFNYEFDRSDKPVRTGDRAIVFGQVIF